MSKRPKTMGPTKGKSWIWHTLDLRESAVWRSLSLIERRE